MSSGSVPHPVNIAIFPTGELALVWSDGHESFYGGHYLRCACPCAGCVDEMTGVKTLRDDRVPSDVRPEKVATVGRYALNVLWSDGHDTGIYSFETLRLLCPCDDCKPRR
jgi:DUF971 family protein